jgi:hypothetical protein
VKKITASLFLLLLCFGAMSFTHKKPVDPPRVLKASDFMIPVGKEGKKISLLELATISRTELESLTGRKMTGMQRMAFKGTQRKLKKGINANGEITNKKLKKGFR